MNRFQHNDAGRLIPDNRRLPLFLRGTRRAIPMVTSLILLSGCSTLSELAAQIPPWTGGEGKIAERVSSQTIDAAPVTAQTPTPDPEPAFVPAGPTREEVKAVQSDLVELGYNPGEPDGVAGPLTTEAIKAYQKDAGLEPDGRITQILIFDLAAAPRPEKPAAPETTETAETTETTEIPEPMQDPDPEVELAVIPPVAAVHVENAGIPPLYNPGDAYIWSNGRVETVIRVAGSKLFWRVDNGVRFTADRNFLVPPSSWAGPAGGGESDAHLGAGKFWPLKTSSPVTFEVDENGQLQSWHCRATGTEHMVVPAGQFDVATLTCDRNRAPPGEWVRRIWYYAPAVRHYVARTDVMPSGSRISKKLMGIRPGAEEWPPAVRAGLDRAIQEALGGLPAGNESLWSSTMVKDEFVIRPGPEFKSDEGQRCRTFELQTQSAGVSRVYPALACMSGEDRKWRIQGGDGVGADDDSFVTSSS